MMKYKFTYFALVFQVVYFSVPDLSMKLLISMKHRK